MKRPNKFWRKNESEVMKRLGLVPTKNSGAGEVEKGDGQSEYLICELKSTDAVSARLQLQDIHRLEHHAMVSHKLPVFAIQFLKTDDVYLLVSPENLFEVAKHIETGNAPKTDFAAEILDINDKPAKTDQKPKRRVIGGGNGRESYNDERSKKYDKTKNAN